MIRVLLAVAAVMALASCEPSIDADGNMRAYHNFSDVTYFYDERTLMCFAQSGSGNQYTMAAVPCTKEVRLAIVADLPPEKEEEK